MTSTAPHHDIVSAIVAAHRARPGALLPLLHAVQDAIGHIPADAVPQIAAALNLSRAEVHGVVSYYPHFRTQPAGRHVVRVCRAEACRAVGGDELLAHAQARLGCGLHQTTADGAVTLEPVSCLGQCATGPALLVDADELHVDVDALAFDQLAASLRGGAK